MSRLLFVVGVLYLLTESAPLQAAEPEKWPVLPAQDAAIEIPVQEWPQRPGPRTARILVRYPGGKLSGVNKDTGLMLTLHNWGGTDFAGTANPAELVEKLNVVAIGVNYLQSGKKDSIDGPEPYDFGYLQALDSLRALAFVFNGFKAANKPFAAGRIYCTGGSGGGNVTLMANKLAPRTFACVVDMCGMKKLSDDIAFNLPGGSDLDARYSRDPKSKNYLSIDEQEIRYLGHPEHLAVMKKLGNATKIFTVHGVDDVTCPFKDAEEMVFWMKRAKLDVVPHFITKADLDGKIFASSGHALGNRTQIVFKVAGKHLLSGNTDALVLAGKTDFERREDVRFPTSNGSYVISYSNGYPVGRFEPVAPPVAYPDHTDVAHYRDREDRKQPIRTVADWEIRRQHVVANVERVMGQFPSQMRRVPLDVKVVEEKRVGDLIRRKVTYQSDPDDRVAAYIFVPATTPPKKLPAVLCLHQTTKNGKDESAGVQGNPDLKYGLELAERGFVTIMPDYPSFGEHKYDFDPKHGYASGSMKAIWDNVRAVDLLETLPEVSADRIGVIGHSLGGHNAMFTALFEPRLKAIVSSCGFTTFRKDDMPSWTGKVYMPRIKNEFDNDASKVPFDFQEIVAAFAPRAFLACAADKDSDFDVSGVRDVMDAAKPIFKLFDATNKLAAYYPMAPHSFPQDARKKAYEFLEGELRR
ncbi:MAG: alpha/beta fold hydrolase [Planctomycetes bacterium]|nr:alpha/beta fold hydrolase [Planctomycetota bacterium]